jgi:hypothetical protein
MQQRSLAPVGAEAGGKRLPFNGGRQVLSSPANNISIAFAVEAIE